MVDIVQNGLRGVLIASDTNIFSAVHGILIHNNIIYISDVGNHCIKVCTPEGIIIRLAGGGISGSQAGSNDGTGTSALFNQPAKMAIDSSGQNLYIVDKINHKIRKLNISNGVVTTIAGGSTSGMHAGSANGTGIAALFSAPHDIAIDTNGDLYIADWNNNFIRKIITTTGAVSTYVGMDNIDNPARLGNVGVYKPFALTIDASNNLYVLDHMTAFAYRRILKIDTSRNVSKLYDVGVFTYGAATKECTSITINRFNNALYLKNKTIDGGVPIHSIDVLKIKDGIEFLGSRVHSARSDADYSERILDSFSIAVDSLDNVYVADNTSNAIRVYSGSWGVAPTIISPTTTRPPIQAIPVTPPGTFGWIAGNWVQYYAPVTHYYVVKSGSTITNIIFMFNDGTNTKIVDWDGKACYYIGPISNFNYANLASYANTTTQYIYVPQQNIGIMYNASRSLPIKAVTNYFNLPMMISLDSQYIRMVSKNRSAYFVNMGSGNIAKLSSSFPASLQADGTNYIVDDTTWTAYYTMINNTEAANAAAAPRRGGGGAAAIATPPAIFTPAATPPAVGGSSLALTPTESPCGMAFDPLGNIYVSYPQSNNIYKQNQLYFPMTSGGIQLNTPLGLCYLNNMLYIADWGNSRIVAYNGTTAITIAMSKQPYGLCSIGNTLYISAEDFIYRYNNTISIVSQNSQANYMFMCTDGVKLYVCDNNSKSVITINP